MLENSKELQNWLNQLGDKLKPNANARKRLIENEIARIQGDMIAGIDANGNRFAPVSNNSTPLLKSRRMLNSFMPIGDNGFGIDNVALYANKHLQGLDVKQREFMRADVSASRIASDWQRQLADEFGKSR